MSGEKHIKHLAHLFTLSLTREIYHEVSLVEVVLKPFWSFGSLIKQSRL